jgi:ATP-dependent exoDNAse (exonuclease V) alpha subunit
MIKTPGGFYGELLKHFPHTPTSTQNELFLRLSAFVFDNNKDSLFLLKGYAGTGKTTVVSSLVNNLKLVNLKSVLMAPTGRAAKVIGNYAGKQAFTIHKKIYFPKKAGAGVHFTLQKNKHTNTFFIVDEASMIPDSNPDAGLFESRSLLSDLITYVYSGKNCKLILIGDTAQLPPVKLTLSPALDSSVLEYQYKKEVYEIELDEVMRQHQESGILSNATRMREILQNDYRETFRFDTDFPDIQRLTEGDDILDALFTAFDERNVENTVMIVRSNKRANPTITTLSSIITRVFQ